MIHELIHESIRPDTDEATILLRREVIAAGGSDKLLKRAVRAGQLVRVRHGAYVAADRWAAADFKERHVILARAVHRTHEDRIAFSHHTAAVLYGMDLWKVGLPKVHLTRADGKHGRHASDLVHHEGLLLPEHVRTVRGLPVVDPARAALESASLVNVEQGLVTVDSGLYAELFDRDALERRYLEIEHWPESQGLQVVVRLADGGHQSAGESRTGHLLWRAGLPKPETQFEIRLGEVLIGTVDFAWPEFGLILEFDGKVKYEKYLKEGESAADAVFREKKREDRIREVTKWTVIRVTWADLANPAQLIARIRRAMRQAAA